MSDIATAEKQFPCPKCENRAPSKVMSERTERNVFAGQEYEQLRREWVCSNGHSFQTAGGNKEEAAP